ncbi:tigger transposable element-derived protein 1-like [Phymastichus coffea]|uniref:tigger transposable element-derived protein 1-like n=1 Tax=Phymastichus coffea TaxID=108790 RepID=UPI00273BBD3F|nr:tigger transposable element-derived protein 1-like [Phymastichus coffea]
MAPTPKTPKTPKTPRSKKVMSLADKLKILNLIRDGEKIACIVKIFSVNESTIRSIRTNENKIRSSSEILGQHATSVKVVQRNTLEKTEEMLLIWLQDLIHKKIPVSTAAIRDQAIQYHNYLNTKYERNDKFNASKGWFENFKTRYSLHSLKFSDESASADHEAARHFPPILQETISEKKYVLDQIFNCDETGLFWKRMPNRTWIAKEEKRAPGFKVAKDRFTLLFCANASGGFKCKPMLVYRAENPRVLKGKNKDHLPVYWKSNKTAWVTQVNFEQWFKESFIPDVKQYLLKKNLAFKVLLLLDNCKSHHSIADIHPDVEVMFFPTNTTSLIQPMDQTVIATFKAYYLRRVMKKMLQEVNHHRTCDGFDSTYVVKMFWKKFSILDAISLVEESWTEVKPTTVSASWKKILPTVDAAVVPEYQEPVRSIIHLAREVGGEGFEDLHEPEILEEIVMPVRTDLSAEEAEELIVPLPQDNLQDNEDVVPTVFGGTVILEIINLLKTATEIAIERDPIVVRSLNFKHNCEKAVEVYEDLYKDALRRAKQSRLTDYFKSN